MGDGAQRHHAPPPTTMRLFEGRVLLSAQAGGGDSNAPDSQPPSKRARTQPAPSAPGPAPIMQAVDGVLYTGGLVWCSAWCPDAPATPPQPSSPSSAPLAAAEAPPTVLGTGAGACEVLALGVHPKGVVRSRVGAAVSGPGAVQVWCVPASSAIPSHPQASPALVCGLLHDGRVAWDVQWCPDPWQVMDNRGLGGGDSTGDSAGGGDGAVSDPIVPCVGCLAMVLGDGSVRVVCVPAEPGLRQAAAAAVGAGAVVAAGAGAGAGAAGSALGVRVAPAAVIGKEAMGGSLASCVAWRPNSVSSRLRLSDSESDSDSESEFVPGVEVGLVCGCPRPWVSAAGGGACAACGAPPPCTHPPHSMRPSPATPQFHNHPCPSAAPLLPPSLTPPFPAARPAGWVLGRARVGVGAARHPRRPRRPPRPTCGDSG